MKLPVRILVIVSSSTDVCSYDRDNHMPPDYVTGEVVSWTNWLV